VLESMPHMARSVPDRLESDTAPCQVALPSGATITHLNGQTRIAEHPGFGAAWISDDLDELIAALIHLREMRAGAR
jgi:hypothetical protein